MDNLVKDQLKLARQLADGGNKTLNAIPKQDSRTLAIWECALQLGIAFGVIPELSFNTLVGAITHERNIVRKEDR